MHEGRVDFQKTPTEGIDNEGISVFFFVTEFAGDHVEVVGNLLDCSSL